jgi:hypothetical protein
MYRHPLLHHTVSHSSAVLMLEGPLKVPRPAVPMNQAPLKTLCTLVPCGVDSCRPHYTDVETSLAPMNSMKRKCLLNLCLCMGTLS